MPDTKINDKSVKLYMTFLRELFSKLLDNDIDCAIIHNCGELERSLESDIDIALGEHPLGSFQEILREICKTHDLTIMHALHYEVRNGYYFIIAQKNSADFLHLDCLHDQSGINRYITKSNFMLKDKFVKDGIPYVSPEKTTLYLLLKRAIKGDITQDRYDELCKTLANDTQDTVKQLRAFAGNNTESIIKKLKATHTPEEAESILLTLRDDLENNCFKRHPVKRVTRAFYSFIRKARRFIRPTGYFIVIAGPDGSGKSTITDALQHHLRRGFRRQHRFHWRPCLIPKLSKNKPSQDSEDEDSNAPATQSKYGGFVSLIRFAYYTMDFILGYWFMIYPLKAQTTLIIGERYFADIPVHPERYGFSLPRWLMRLTSLLIPDPDLVILLSNDAETIHQRKAELTVEAIKSQLSAYNKELPRWGKFVTINTNPTPDVIAQQIASIIISGCKEKTIRYTGTNDV